MWELVLVIINDEEEQAEEEDEPDKVNKGNQTSGGVACHKGDQPRNHFYPAIKVFLMMICIPC